MRSRKKSLLKKESLFKKIHIEKLSREALFSVAIELNIPEIIALCKTNKQIDEKLCKQDAIWEHKLEQIEEPKNIQNLREETKLKGRELYKLIYSLNKIKRVWKIWNIIDNIYELYKEPDLYLAAKNISEIPKEISILSKIGRAHV